MVPFESIIFYCAGAALLLAGLGVVTLRNPVHCALLLVVCFLSTAVLWLLLGAEFLAWVLVLVYVGAVMVLFLFVVMMLDVNLDRFREGFWSKFPAGILVTAVLGVIIYSAVKTGIFATGTHIQPQSAIVPEDYSHAREIGKVVYTDYLLAFEAAAVVLLIAIIAAIALTMRRRPENKQLDPSEQIGVKAETRVRMEQVVLDKPKDPEPEEAGEQDADGQEGAKT